MIEAGHMDSQVKLSLTNVLTTSTMKLRCVVSKASQRPYCPFVSDACFLMLIYHSISIAW